MKTTVELAKLQKIIFKVTLNEIERKIKDIGIDNDFIKTVEAIEYYETMAMLEKMGKKISIVGCVDHQ